MRANNSFYAFAGQLLMFPLLVFGFICLFSLVHAPKAAADTCANHNGQYFQVNIAVRVENNDGTNAGIGRGYTFSVKATVPDRTAVTGSARKDIADAQKRRLLGNGDSSLNNSYTYGNETNSPFTYNVRRKLAAINNSNGSPKTGGNNSSEPSQNETFTASSSNLHSCTGPAGDSRPTFDFTDGTNNNPMLTCLGGGIVSSDNYDLSAKFYFDAASQPTEYQDSAGNWRNIASGNGHWSTTVSEHHYTTPGPTATEDNNQNDIKLTWVYVLDPVAQPTTITPHADLPTPGPYTGGQNAQIHTWVTKDAGTPNTSSTWNRIVWYESGTNDDNDSADTIIYSKYNGGPTTYNSNSPGNDVSDGNNNVVIDGTKKRICVKLNLTGVGNNNAGATTNVTGDPAIYCRNITQTGSPPTGNLTCSTSGNQWILTPTFSDPDGATTATVGTGTSGTSRSDVSSNPTSGTSITITAGTTTKTYYLFINDVGPGAGSPVQKSATCNPPAQNLPDGNISFSCTNPATNQQTVNFSFWDDDATVSQYRAKISTSSSGPGTGTEYSWTGTAPSPGVSTSTNPPTVITQANAGAVTYYLYVMNNPAGGGSGTYSNTYVASASSVNCQQGSTDNPPTGNLTVSCNGTTQYVVSYYGVGDNEGTPQAQVGTSSSPSGNIIAPNYQASNSVTRSATGSTTYYLYVQNILPGGGVGNWIQKDSRTFDVSSCASTPPQGLNLQPKAQLYIPNGSGGWRMMYTSDPDFAPGTPVSTYTAVNKLVYGACDYSNTASSNWTRWFWYENDAATDSSNYDIYSSSDTPITDLNSPPAPATPATGYDTYTSCEKAVAHNTTTGLFPKTTIDGTKRRICVGLRLSNPSGAVIYTAYDATCKNIAQAAGQLRPIASVDHVTPGPLVAGSSHVKPRASIQELSGTGDGKTNWNCYFWYDMDGNGVYNDGTDSSSSTTYCAPPSGTTTILRGSTQLVSNDPDLGPIPNNTKKVCTRLVLSGATGGTTYPNGTENVTCDPVSDTPYLKITHGDINTTTSVSSLFGGGTCTQSATGHITAFTGSYGSGTEIADYAGSTITGFASALLKPIAPKGLTFANTPTTASQQYGIPFGAALGCNTDPDWAKASTVASGPATVSGYTYGTKYVNGDAYIDQPITYPATFPAALSANNIPMFKLVATGNIFIKDTVTRVDGILMAKGTIYTCTGSSSAPANLTNVPATCYSAANKLTVNGSLIAPHIQFLRMAGSLNDAAPAESIIYDPTVWLRALNGASGDQPIDAYTTLPPVL